MKNIYEIYIPVTDQPMSDRLKAICLKYKLPIWKDELAFLFESNYQNYFYSNDIKEFSVGSYLGDTPRGKTESTESEFIALLENNTEKCDVNNPKCENYSTACETCINAFAEYKKYNQP